MNPCLVCQGPIPKKPHESRARYQGKKFCSQLHAKEYMKANKIGWFSSDIHAKKVRKDWPDEDYITQTSND